MKSPSKEKKGLFRRILDLGDDAQQDNPYAQASRKDLLATVAQLQAQNQALHSALSIAHEKQNQALRMLGTLYQFMFGIVYAYMTALQNFKEAGNEKPLPSMWIAARVCEHFELLFEKHDLQELDIGPNTELLRNVYRMAGRALNPGSKIASYLGIPAHPVDAIKDTLAAAGHEIDPAAEAAAREVCDAPVNADGGTDAAEKE